MWLTQCTACCFDIVVVVVVGDGDRLIMVSFLSVWSRLWLTQCTACCFVIVVVVGDGDRLIMVSFQSVWSRLWLTQCTACCFDIVVVDDINNEFSVGLVTVVAHPVHSLLMLLLLTKVTG